MQNKELNNTEANAVNKRNKHLYVTFGNKSVINICMWFLEIIRSLFCTDHNHIRFHAEPTSTLAETEDLTQFVYISVNNGSWYFSEYLMIYAMNHE